MTNMMENFIHMINHIIKPKCFSKEILKTVKLKHRSFCEYTLHCSSTTVIIYIEVQNKCKSIVRLAREKYERSIGLACENNPTLFWKYVQRKLKMPTGISSLLDGNTLVSSEKDKANLPSMYFSRIYAKENMNNLPVAY